MQSFDPGYGRCPCSGMFETGTVEVTFKSGLKLEDVPQGACPNCKGRVYKAFVLGQVEAAFIEANSSNRNPQ